MTFPQHLIRATSRVVLGASLALTTLWIADANPAGASRGGGDQEIEDAGDTTTTTQATTTTTQATPPTTADLGSGDAGDGLDTQAPADLAVEPAAEVAPAAEQLGEQLEIAPAAEVPQPRPSLPRTGAGSVTQEALLGFGLVGAGLAATVAGRRHRRSHV